MPPWRNCAFGFESNFISCCLQIWRRSSTSINTGCVQDYCSKYMELDPLSLFVNKVGKKKASAVFPLATKFSFSKWCGVGRVVRTSLSSVSRCQETAAGFLEDTSNHIQRFELANLWWNCGHLPSKPMANGQWTMKWILLLTIFLF